MQKFTWKTILKYRNLIYGISAIWIVLFHLVGYHRIGVPAVSSFLSLGNMGVDIFLFLSAIGLSFSIEKNSLGHFYKNRFKRTFLTHLLISVPFFVWMIFVIQGGALADIPLFLENVFTISYWRGKDYVMWYIPCILVLYIFFPFLYKLHRKSKYNTILMIALSVIIELTMKHFDIAFFHHAERTLSRIPVFLMGLYVSDFVKSGKKVSYISVIVAFLLVTVLIIIRPINTVFTFSDATMKLLCERYSYSILSISMIISVTFLINLVEKYKITKLLIKMFSFLGGLSLEIYLVHVCMLRLIVEYNLMHTFKPWVYYIGVLGLSIILGLLFNKIPNKIIKNKI